MKRILVIINNFCEVSHNQHLLRLLLYLSEHHLEITLVTINPTGELKPKFFDLPVSHLSVSQLRQYLKHHPKSLILTKELRSEYLVFFYRYIYGYKHLKHYTIRPSFGFLADTPWHICKNLLFLISLHLVDLNIAVGSTVAQKIHSKVICIPNSIPKITLHANHPGVRKFVYSGYLEPRKNLLYMLSLIKEISIPYECHILGLGPQQDLLHSYIDTHHMHQVKLHGYVPNVQDYLNQADIFIFLTKMEGLSLSLLEAMGTGLICIVSDIPENREVITDGVNGILLPLNQRQSAISKLTHSLALEKCKFMGKQARITIANKYTDAISFKKYLDILTS